MTVRTTCALLALCLLLPPGCSKSGVKGGESQSDVDGPGFDVDEDATDDDTIDDDVDGPTDDAAEGDSTSGDAAMSDDSADGGGPADPDADGPDDDTVVAGTCISDSCDVGNCADIAACADVLGCIEACDDTACAEACLADAPEAVTSTLGGVVVCGVFAGCLVEGGDPPGGDCCEAQDTGGCSDEDCAAAVCELDDYCCAVEWDDICAGMAADTCDICEGDGPECGDDACDEGESCGTCPSDCGECPKSDCCEPHEDTGCADEACQAHVCADDAFCCNASWDEACVELAMDLCDVCEGGGPFCGDGVCDGFEGCEECPDDCGPCGGEGDCCAPHDGVGCDDGECAEQICANDPFCCEAEWDDVCADQAVAACEVCGGGGPICGDGVCEEGEDCEADCGGGGDVLECLAIECGAGDCYDNDLCADTLFCIFGCDSEECAIGCIQGAPGFIQQQVIGILECGSESGCFDGVGPECGDGACNGNESCNSCPDDCGPCGGGTCCEANDGVGCDDAGCQDAVCAQDGYCCDVNWDGICAELAGEICAGCGGPGPVCGDGICESGEVCLEDCEQVAVGCLVDNCNADQCLDNPQCFAGLECLSGCETEECAVECIQGLPGFVQQTLIGLIECGSDAGCFDDTGPECGDGICEPGEVCLEDCEPVAVGCLVDNCDAEQCLNNNLCFQGLECLSGCETEECAIGCIEDLPGFVQQTLIGLIECGSDAGCFEDTGPVCGDGVCEPGEACPADCDVEPLECLIEHCDADQCLNNAVCAGGLECLFGCETEECAIGCIQDLPGFVQQTLIGIVECGIDTGCFEGGGGPECGDNACNGDETCGNCPQDCGPCPGGNCCEPHDGTGCDDDACTAQICAQDPFCCDNQWDGICANAASEQCEVCGGGGPVCGDGVCEPGEACPEDCDTPGSCVTDSCQTGNCGDFQLCAEALACVAACDDVACAESCIEGSPEPVFDFLIGVIECGVDAGCFEPEPPGCGDGACTATESCASCPADCGPCAGGSCCEANDGVGCSDPNCEAVVCAQDPFCCDNSWDGICANQAEEICEVCNGGGPVCGDGICEPGESCDADCDTGPVCGDGVCEPGEACEIDCGPDPGCLEAHCDFGNCPNFEACSAALDCIQTCDGEACAAACVEGLGPNATQFLNGLIACGVDAGCIEPEGPGCGDGQCDADESCSTCAIDCGQCPAGSCCEGGNEPGCEDPECEAAVCEQDPFCCESAWDGICADIASQTCEACGAGGPVCGDGVCEPGEDCNADCGPEPGCLEASCDYGNCLNFPNCAEALACIEDCATEACAEGCIEGVGNNGAQFFAGLIACGVEAGCLDPTAGPVCGDGACSGDEDCGSCPGDCGACPVGDCCEPTDTPGCNDPECEAIVCELDPFCCDASWDGICSGMAQEECACGGGGPVCGDGVCEEGEVCDTDCDNAPVCGDGVCEQGEDCPADCVDPGNCLEESCNLGACPDFPDCAEALECMFECTTEDCAGACLVGQGPEIQQFLSGALACGVQAGCYEPVVEPDCGDGQCDPVIGESCETCPLDCGACGAGDCCEANGSPGCEDPECEALICEADPFCCESQWDGICSNAAEDNCEACGATGGGCGDGLCGADESCGLCPVDCGGCAGDCCSANGTAGCGSGPCMQTVCEVAPECCVDDWSLDCAELAAQVCEVCEGGPECGNGQCEAGESQDNCPVDCGGIGNPFCGDGECNANETCAQCQQDCGPCPGECCEANGSPGCEDTPCQQLVCNEDLECCYSGWDDLCAELAAELCIACSGAECGNGVCEDGENSNNCPADCDQAPSCGDGDCGDDETCSSCAEDCGPCEGDCCADNGGGSPGCNDPECEASICDADPFCCQVTWDVICASAAEDTCDGCGGPTCGDGVCEDGEDCPTDCAQSTEECLADSCGFGNCQNFGPCSAALACIVECDDSACAEACIPNIPAANFLQNLVGCGEEAGCFEAGTGPSCGDGECNGQETCATCAGDCGDCEGDCCSANDTLGCEDATCQAQVCEADPFCCDTAWDDGCADQASECEVCPDSVFDNPLFQCVDDACGLDECISSPGCFAALECVAECDGFTCLLTCVQNAPPQDQGTLLQLYQCGQSAGCL